MGIEKAIFGASLTNHSGDRFVALLLARGTVESEHDRIR